MSFVRDLEAIDTVFVRPLREKGILLMNPFRLDTFISEVIDPSYLDILAFHRDILARLQYRQLVQHPRLIHIAECFSVVLTPEWHEAYVKYLGNTGRSEARLAAELRGNTGLKALLEVSEKGDISSC